MSDSFRAKVENKNPGNTRAFALQLPTDLAAWAEPAAMRKSKTAEQLIGELIIKTIDDEEEAMSLELRLLHEP